MMAILTQTGSIKCLFLLYFAFITELRAEELPTLEILPNRTELTRAIDSSVALTCKANVQDPSLISQLEWRDNRGRKIENTRPELLYVQSLPGEPGQVLILSRLTENLGGTYTCHANYAHTEHLSASITVTTIVDITFVNAPENQYPISGIDYVIRCEVQANPAPIISWEKDGVPIISNGRYIVDTKGLIVKNIKESDDGVYVCRAVVVKTGHLQTRNIKVEVQVPPRMLPMKEVSVVEGSTASVQCNATGKPPPTYSWIKERTREDLSITNRFKVMKDTGLLLITDVKYDDNGKYICRAENKADKAEATVKVNVLIKPKIYELINITAPVGSDTKIICKANGRPAPKVSFRKKSNGDSFSVGVQPDDRRIVLEQTVDEIKGETFGVLNIRGLNRSDDGLYECIARNEVDTAVLNGHVTVEFMPTFEKIKNYPPVWIWGDKIGNLTCIAESIPNATIKWRYGGIDIKNNSSPVFRIEGAGPISSLIVNPYTQKPYYGKYECLASNRLGDASHLIELREAFRPEPIQQAKIDVLTATTVKFNIIGPPNLHGLPLRAFIVYYLPDRDIDWSFARNHSWSYDAPYILENLTPRETYNVRFAAKNDVGIGAVGGNLRITMPSQSVPAEPKILISNSADANSPTPNEIATVSPYGDRFELKWNVPNDNGSPIDSYIIRFCTTEKINGEWREKECSDELTQPFQHTSYQLTTLESDTVYKIELRAHNSIGHSSPAQIRIKTARGYDPGVYKHESTNITSAMIIGIVIAAIVFVIIIVDLLCFCVNRSGILAFICNKAHSKPHQEDPKLSSEEKEPLKSETPGMNGDKRNLSVEFDGKTVYTKPMEIGRHSAV